MKVICFVAGVLLVATSAVAQPRGAGEADDRPHPFAIVDNSFFVEEAFNQEEGVFQNIFGVLRIGGRWTASFTQEWPAGSETHQLSYTLAWADTGTASGIGDTLVNYRYQVWEEGRGRPAWAPRASLILPTGQSTQGLGGGSAGLQVNLPFSKQAADTYLHWNAGTTWLFRARRQAGEDDAPPAVDERRSLVSPFVAGSIIYRARPMLHLMLESVVSWDASYVGDGVVHETSVTLAPGFRSGWNLGHKQVVIGAALPVVWTQGDGRAGIFAYLSYELPFR